MGKVDREQIGEWLSAYIDNELNEQQNAVIERLVREDPKVRRLLEELQTTTRLVSSLPRHSAPPGVSEDVMRHIERDELLGPGGEPVPGAARRRLSLRPIATAAAALIIVFGGAWWYLSLSRPAGSPMGVVADAGKKKGLAEPPQLEREALPLRQEKAAGEKGGRGAEAISRDAFVSRANLDQKLAVNVPRQELIEHSFSNESNAIRLTLASEAERDAVRRKLDDYLTSNHFEDLERQEDLDPDALAGKRIFLKGRQGVNFDARNESQVLLRVPRKDMPELVENLAPTSSKGREIQFQTGILVVEGPEQVTQVANQIAWGTLRDEKGVAEDEGREREALDASEQLDRFVDVFIPNGPRLAHARTSRDVAPPEEPTSAGQEKPAMKANGIVPPRPLAPTEPEDEITRDTERDEDASDVQPDAAGRRGAKGEEVESKEDDSARAREVEPAPTGADERMAGERGPEPHESLAKRRMEEIKQRSAKVRAGGAPAEKAAKGPDVAIEKGLEEEGGVEIAAAHVPLGDEALMTVVIQLAAPPEADRAKLKAAKPATTEPATKGTEAKPKVRSNGAGRKPKETAAKAKEVQ
jgi:hypothetical protein